MGVAPQGETRQLTVHFGAVCQLGEPARGLFRSLSIRALSSLLPGGSHELMRSPKTNHPVCFSEQQQDLLAGDEQVHTPTENEYFSQRWTSEPWTCCCLWSLHTQAEGEGKSLSCVFKKGEEKDKGEEPTQAPLNVRWIGFVLCRPLSTLQRGLMCLWVQLCKSLWQREYRSELCLTHIPASWLGAVHQHREQNGPQKY